MKLLFAIRYQKQVHDSRKAEEIFTDLCDHADFIGGYIGPASANPMQEMIQMIPKFGGGAMLGATDEETKRKPAEPVMLTVFFRWPLDLPSDSQFFLPEECRFIVIPEALRHEYGIRLDAKFHDPLEKTGEQP